MKQPGTIRIATFVGLVVLPGCVIAGRETGHAAFNYLATMAAFTVLALLGVAAHRESTGVEKSQTVPKLTAWGVICFFLLWSLFVLFRAL